MRYEIQILSPKRKLASAFGKAAPHCGLLCVPPLSKNLTLPIPLHKYMLKKCEIIREAGEDGTGFALSGQLSMFRGEVQHQETLDAKQTKLVEFFAPKAS